MFKPNMFKSIQPTFHVEIQTRNSNACRILVNRVQISQLYEKTPGIFRPHQHKAGEINQRKPVTFIFLQPARKNFQRLQPLEIFSHTK